MGVVGAALRGFGKALKKHKQGKMLKGKSTREDRLKYGERGPTIKSVKPAISRDASPEKFEASRQYGALQGCVPLAPVLESARYSPYFLFKTLV